MRSFGSDNNSGVHPLLLQAMIDANKDHAIGYGDDDWTREAEKAVKKLIGKEDIESFFIFNGTGANVIALQACTLPFHHIVCPSTAHIAVDECGAPVRFTGCALKEIATSDGKLTPGLVRPLLHGFGVEHHSQPKVIAISQTTEMGTAYTPREIKLLADLAHEHDMYLFVDGTRMANASAFLNVSVKEMTVDCGVDIFTFGGTKNGLMMGEVLVPLRKELAENLKYYRKQTTQLYSKMRFISAQFIPYFNKGVWLDNARRSNVSAQKLAAGMREAGVKLTQEVQSNAVFFILSEEKTDKLRERYFFYDWDAARNERRLVCSWDTTDEDIAGFISYLQSIV
ncbi:MAG TPA: aminotransferase class V-fold PLP-dependent enzyme [Petrimonas sp.]|uniref:threonine aldolase family protein n=1 Tax=Petrimonas sp. TaxID=2023866 RepID=UPI00176E90D5|nr:aminotransferase class I/II-fold pyridoxal phosphate-dependent enzyme [Petrimonas sp.]MEA4949638.1 aminotransferase class I/II-fold pyridoxal phosphate-dependent enzyme [Petrimonas sp.]MEA4980653.1 aminotransferase class I/II-fold pyridoxal phosphate-dependent enzyme [Petrimonas sp.]MEA5063966.1 aminotransferase class I/II-fold pyridoxal phosphate-dependent enzyme [Petrimonas sp.]HHV85568.1 aminotransferase class V-fold PLP-dependent enzyme [Petrimonas sp.]